MDRFHGDIWYVTHVTYAAIAEESVYTSVERMKDLQLIIEGGFDLFPRHQTLGLCCQKRLVDHLDAGI